MILVAAILIPFCPQAEEAFTHRSFDGYKIDAKLALPKGEVGRVVVLLGGSGPYDMDLDLAAVSGGKKNLWLKDVSDALVGKGFATLRYHKRAYHIQQWGLKVRAEKRQPTKEEMAPVNAFMTHPLKCFVDDCKSFAEYARKRFPKAKIYLLGASEGTHVGLFAADELKWISGVALVGFYLKSLEVVMYEQGIHRDLVHFRTLDKNGDEVISKEEFQKGGFLAPAILKQMGPYDRDGDGALTLAEYKSMALAVHARYEAAIKTYRLDEANYPTMLEILRRAAYPVAFFQGLWDNQTPAFNAMAVEAIAKHAWKKEGFTFRYFANLGHCLDPRNGYYDVLYRPIDPKALGEMAADMGRLFR